MIRHFLAISSFSTSQLSALIDRAHYFSSLPPDQTPPLLKNKILANLFYEPSTRTRCSFEIAAKRLGSEVVNFVPENSIATKGESLYDTVKTMEALGADAIVLRHADDRVFEQLAPLVKAPLINAGAGKYEHPTQGLLDLLTLRQEFSELRGLRLAVCGDIRHSRVAGSLLAAAAIFGFEVFICGPESLLPQATPPARVAAFDEILPSVDAVMLLRIQLERHQSLELDAETYHRRFGLTTERLDRLKPGAIIMHPGPFNRGVEICEEAVEHPRSRIFKQVSNGVAARMAILEWVLERREFV